LRCKMVDIALVASVVARYDAISLAVRDTYFALKRNGFPNVVLFCERSDYNDMSAVIVSTVAELLMARPFFDADLIIYHFGIYHSLFDALLIGNGKAKQAVVYHNTTPPEFVAEKNRDVIHRSLVQIHNLGHADRLWPVSPFNGDCLRELSFDGARIEVIPLVVQKPDMRSPLTKSDSGDRILFVGRAVESKGLLDALTAFEALLAGQPSARFVVAYNGSFSDSNYLDLCNQFIERRNLLPAVTMLESADDEKLCELFAEAHVLLLPTCHEGFCVPVVEALRAGAITVGFDAGNMSNVCEGLGRLVPVGDLPGLTKRLLTVVDELRAAHLDPGARTIELDRGALTLLEFEAEGRWVVQQYSSESVTARICDGVSSLLDL
jgi:glycosyltransferase involved in cell wall biosynthesis